MSSTFSYAKHPLFCRFVDQDMNAVTIIIFAHLSLWLYYYLQRTVLRIRITKPIVMLFYRSLSSFLLLRPNYASQQLVVLSIFVVPLG